MPRRLATVDIGTNTTLLLIAEAGGAGVEVIAERAEITRLGRGIGSGAGRPARLAPDKIEATLAVLRGYADLARSHAAPIAAVGTEALRRAENARDFLVPAATILGALVEVIDGEREAALTFLAAARSFPDAVAGDAVVIDIGGGSTEIVLAHAGEIVFRTSLPLGSVRLTEGFIRSDPPSASEITALGAAIAERLAEVPFEKLASPPTLIGTAGTVTTFAAMAQDLADYDPAKVHGYRLSRTDLERQIDRLGRSQQSERERMMGLDPRRADVILAGGCLLDAIAARVGVRDILVSDRGIRWGLLFERLLCP